jgi:hypothetical protein
MLPLIFCNNETADILKDEEQPDGDIKNGEKGYDGSREAGKIRKEKDWDEQEGKCPHHLLAEDIIYDLPQLDSPLLSANLFPVLPWSNAYAGVDRSTGLMQLREHCGVFVFRCRGHGGLSDTGGMCFV